MFSPRFKTAFSFVSSVKMFCGLLTAGFAIEAAKVRRRQKSTDDGPEQLVKRLSVGRNLNARAGLARVARVGF
jgi:hypothetical protein